MTTAAATRFIDAIMVSWDSLEPYQATAEKGLADVDEDTLQTYCDESDEDYGDAEAEVLAFVRGKLMQTREIQTRNS